MHHIVSDGWSMGVLARELGTLYGAFRRGEENPLEPLEIQYRGLCGVAAGVGEGRAAGEAEGVLAGGAGGCTEAAGVADGPAAAGAAELCRGVCRQLIDGES